MNKILKKALKANVARTEIAGKVNTKWTPDAINIKKKADEGKFSFLKKLKKNIQKKGKEDEI